MINMIYIICSAITWITKEFFNRVLCPVFKPWRIVFCKFRINNSCVIDLYKPVFVSVYMKYSISSMEYLSRTLFIKLDRFDNFWITFVIISIFSLLIIIFSCDVDCSSKRPCSCWSRSKGPISCRSIWFTVSSTITSKHTVREFWQIILTSHWVMFHVAYLTKCFLNNLLSILSLFSLIFMFFYFWIKWWSLCFTRWFVCVINIFTSWSSLWRISFFWSHCTSNMGRWSSSRLTGRFIIFTFFNW